MATKTVDTPVDKKTLRARLGSLDVELRRYKGKIQWMPLDQLTHHPHEPFQRLQPSALVTLGRHMVASGICAPIIVIAQRGEWIVVDGNRRFALAGELGWASIECYVIDGADVDVAFARLNAATRTMGNKEWLTFMAGIPPTKWPKLLAVAPKAFARQFKKLEKIMGADYITELGLTGKVGPNMVVTYAERLQAIGQAKDVGFTLKAVIPWIVSCNMQNVLNTKFRAMKHGTDTFSRSLLERIRKCVVAGKPFHSKRA